MSLFASGHLLPQLNAQSTAAQLIAGPYKVEPGGFARAFPALAVHSGRRWSAVKTALGAGCLAVDRHHPLPRFSFSNAEADGVRLLGFGPLHSTLRQDLVLASLTMASL